MKLIVSIISVVVLVGLVSKGWSQSSQDLTEQAYGINTITTAVPFLLIAPDARGGAMGDAGAGTSPDVYSMHYNPAKYAFIDKNVGFSVSYSPWLSQLVNDISLGYLTGYKKIDDDQVLAGSLRYFSLGNIVFTDNVGTEIGQFSPNEFAVDVAYSRKFSDYIGGAIALRYIYSNLTGGIYVNGAQSKPGQSIATDIAVYYEKEIDMGKTPAVFSFGADISNIGAKITYTENQNRSFIPINMRLGPSLTMDLDDYNQLMFTFDFNKLLVPTPPIYAEDSAGQPIKDDNGDYVIADGKDPKRSIVSGMFGSFSDAPGGFKEEVQELSFSLGTEYWYDQQFALRAGFFYEHPNKGNRKYITLGAGLRYNVFGLDFSYLIPLEQRNPLENTLRFTLVFNFDKVKS
ncbi:MAG TPA: type IX secretion system outer membrane channel protein PorV [Bacteroidales bacterium]|nr:type IX secretion system outer membrane channel protein PorV [Bacteroidales bacterium]